MKYTFLLFIIFCSFLGNFTQAQKFIFEEPPQWVSEIDTLVNTEVSKYDVISGFYVSLIDYQVNLAEDATFYHQVINVVSFNGITNASQLAIKYDTSYQELKIHHLYIWRKGEKIDQTNKLSLETLSNEENLNQGIYTGIVKAYDILEDIRKDDRIDFAYTLVGNNPIFEDEKYLFYPLESFNPIDYYSIRVIYPHEKDYIFKCVDCETDHFSESVSGDFKQIKIEYSNVPAMKLEKSIPSWYLPFKYFMLSSLHSWRDVNEWAEGVFALETEPKLDDVMEEVFVGNENMDEKIDKLIDYVQDDIRYMGVETGIGSIKPFPPEQVVRQRFGDCKDKSLLLVSLLKKIGISKAFPVLVNTGMQEDIDKFLPAAGIFDHCIVNFHYNDTSYWVDPTATQQGGSYKNLSNHDFGKVLIIGVKSDSLQDMDVQSSYSEYSITDEYTIDSFTEPADLKIVSKRIGMEADQRRALLDYVARKDISDLAFKDLGRLFPNSEEVKDVEFKDNIEDNVFITTYEYKISDFWVDGDQKKDFNLRGLKFFRFEPLIIHDYMDQQSCMSRTYPIAINYPFSLDYTIIFHFPDEILIEDNSSMYENEEFYFHEKIIQINKKTVQLNYTLKTLSDEISAGDYLDICRQKEEIKKKLPFVFYFRD